MTRFSLSELRVKKMEESKRKNTTESEDILTLCGAAEEKAKSGESLQDAFKKFRKKRQNAIRLSKQVDKETTKWRADPVKMNKLRMKFVEQCKLYFGVPYAKKYQEPGTEFNAPFFLDCCGLIRRVLRDLKEDFGFEVGPWNQAYMYDTLPLDAEKTDDLKPGDLVFVSGIYHNTKSKKQRHNMVHVEVWAGDGEKTIGARWQKGKVQYHDSYKFNAKSYHSMQYHFKSIDTWLMGICQSHCPEHSWKRSQYRPGKRSIFAEDQANEREDQNAEELSDEEMGSQVNDDKQRPPCSENEIQSSSDKKNLICQKAVSLHITSPDSNTCHETVSSDCPSTTTTAQLSQKNFNNLDECVSWLLTKISMDIESECYDRISDVEAIKLHSSPQHAEHSSSNNPNNDMIPKDHSARKTKMDSTVQSNTDQDCHCPQCCHAKVSCIHQRCGCHYGFPQDNDENDFENLDDCKENSSSLECFDFMHTGMNCDQFVINQCPNNSDSNHSGSKSRRSVSPSKATKNGKDSGSGPSGNRRGNGNEKNNNRDSPGRSGTRSVRGYMNDKQPPFFIGGGNGNWMIESTLVSLGWSRIEDKLDESFKLKWVECKSQINYGNFRDGEHLANHISNINLLTTKLGLLCSLEEYQRVQEKMAKNKLKFPMSEFVPETHKLMNATEKAKFVNEVYKDGEIWICKPTGMNQGKGIYLVNSKEQLIEKLNMNGGDNVSARRSLVRPPQGRVIQRYVMNPLLLNGCKFDIRTYMLIASTTPFIVFYHPGYVRLSCVPYTPYTPDAAGLHAHLTNQYVQKKHPLYSSMKEDTVWSFERLQSYIDEKYSKEKELPENWVYTTFTKRMHQIMTTCFHSVRQKLHKRAGTFDLLGFDFLIDDNFNVWLLEVNINPALHTNCQVLMDLLPGVVDETLKLVIEINDKTKRRSPLFPLENQKGFQLLYNGEGK
ncbi:uncharacterized protein LOC111327109 isoform X2 [Stylophora pistillata]|uniref:uncharacterized protein LOC111327109 isoform X2 n=1 Tax=Stylophora pistillata TaxID=50429 RepID=UPI000C045958|nr:uncharacterized protein LOC111327109 isoform X2 [Stylophora pistillata]